MSSLYLDRYAYPTQFIEETPSSNLNIIITIPCFDEPDLITSLNSLKVCQQPKKDVEVIVVINESENTPAKVSQQNKTSFQEVTQWTTTNNSSNFKTHIIYVNDLPKKHAGVGFARKIAMDEAVRRFETVGKQKGVIACFDADSTCDPNYLMELEQHFDKHPQTPGCSIYFEHPLDEENQEAIILYELYLRYYVNGLRYAGFPYAYHTVGSSMAVRSWAYQKQGGMNRRKAGEDFYFLNRIIPIGNFTELNTTRVVPSPRDSDRVPFGTGRAMMDWRNGKKELKMVYHPQTFKDIKILFDQIDLIYESEEISLPESIQGFLISVDFEKEVKRIRSQSSSRELFAKHFFHWFNGFHVLKYVHFVRDYFYPLIKIEEAIQLLAHEELILDDSKNTKDYLLELRLMDRRAPAQKLQFC